MQRLASFCKKTGFVYSSSEIYGGLSGLFDYGPHGSLLRRNLRDHWWRRFVTERSDKVLGMESTVLMNPRVWQATGHVDHFSDECSTCKKCGHKERDKPKVCPGCSQATEWADAPRFNTLFVTRVGASQPSDTWLRPETCQGMFTNFGNVVNTSRKAHKLPFGLAQVGKAFRNEISPRDFLFRLREFEQFELEWFCPRDESVRWHGYWVEEAMKWLLSLGLKEANLKLVKVEKEDLAHYASLGTDIYYRFPFGWGEIAGIAHRGSYDLERHHQASGDKLIPSIMSGDQVPHVIEPSFGADRIFMALLCDTLRETEGSDARTVLSLPPELSPYKAAVFPLIGDRDPQQFARAESIYRMLQQSGLSVDFDIAGSIGKRYRRQDEIGTPFCYTVDVESLRDGMVTERERESMLQKRIPIADVRARLLDIQSGPAPPLAAP